MNVINSPNPAGKIKMLDVIALHESVGDDLPAGEEGTVVDIFADGLGVMRHLLPLKPFPVYLVWSAANR